VHMPSSICSYMSVHAGVRWENKAMAYEVSCRSNRGKLAMGAPVRLSHHSCGVPSMVQSSSVPGPVGVTHFLHKCLNKDRAPGSIPNGSGDPNFSIGACCGRKSFSCILALTVFNCSWMVCWTKERPCWYDGGSWSNGTF
jgi:hypothetical protein